MSLAALKSQLEAQKKRLEELKQLRGTAAASNTPTSASPVSASVATPLATCEALSSTASATIPDSAPPVATSNTVTAAAVLPGTPIGSTSLNSSLVTANRNPPQSLSAPSVFAQHALSVTLNKSKSSDSQVPSTVPTQPVPTLEDFCTLDQLTDITLRESDLVRDDLPSPRTASGSPNASQDYGSTTITFTAAQRRSAVENLVEFVAGSATRSGKGIEFEALLRKKYSPSQLPTAAPALREKIFLFNWLFNPLSEQYRCYLGLLHQRSDQTLYETARAEAQKRLDSKSSTLSSSSTGTKDTMSSPTYSNNAQHSTGLGFTASSLLLGPNLAASSLVQEHSALLAAFGGGGSLGNLSKRIPEPFPSHYTTQSQQAQTNAIPPPPPPPPPPPLPSSFPFLAPPPPPPLPISSQPTPQAKPQVFVHPSRLGLVPHAEEKTPAASHSRLCTEDMEENRDFEESSNLVDSQSTPPANLANFRHTNYDHEERGSHMGLGAGSSPSAFYYASFTQANPLSNDDATNNPVDRNAAAMAAMEQVYNALATQRGGVRDPDEMRQERNQEAGTSESDSYRDWLYEDARRRGELDVDADNSSPISKPPPPKRAPGAPLDASNPGFRMLMKMGWMEGTPIGRSADARIAPIEPLQRRSNAGVGLGKEAGQGKMANSNSANMGVGNAASATTTAAAAAVTPSPPVDAFEAYRQRMQAAYKNRPNPMGNPRKAYY